MNRVLYATRARRAIVALLRSDRRYFTAAAIHRAIASEIPSTAISTIYRTLELLEGLGTVSRRAGDEKEASFVYCGEEHHHHAICRICGRVEDVRCEAIDEVRASLRRQRGFTLDEHTVEFYGRCASCTGDTLAPCD